MCLCTGNRGDGSSNAARLGASHPLPDLTGASSTLQRLIQSLHAEVVDELSKPIPQRQEVKERKPDGAGDEHAGLCARFTTRRKGSRFGRSVAYSASDLSEHSSMALLVAHEISHQWHVAIESDSKLRGKQRLAAPETDLGQGTQVAIAMASPMPRDATRPPVLTFGDGVMSVLTAAHWHAIRLRMLPMLLLTLAAAVTFDSHDQPTVIILEHGQSAGWRGMESGIRRSSGCLHRRAGEGAPAPSVGSRRLRRARPLTTLQRRRRSCWRRPRSRCTRAPVTGSRSAEQRPLRRRRCHQSM